MHTLDFILYIDSKNKKKPQAILKSLEQIVGHFKQKVQFNIHAYTNVDITIDGNIYKYDKKLPDIWDTLKQYKTSHVLYIDMYTVGTTNIPPTAMDDLLDYIQNPKPCIHAKQSFILLPPQFNEQRPTFKNNMWFNFYYPREYVVEAIQDMFKLRTSNKHTEHAMLVKSIYSIREILSDKDLLRLLDEYLMVAFTKPDLCDLSKVQIAEELIQAMLKPNVYKGISKENIQRLQTNITLAGATWVDPSAKKTGTICFVQMVKNEAPVITRSFNAVLPIIDEWFICDTGSEDGTQDIIINYFKEKNIPGKLVYHDWVNFGFNRTYTFQEARKFSKADYFIFNDADERLMTKDFKPLTLADKERFLQVCNSQVDLGVVFFTDHCNGISFQRSCAVRNDKDYVWDYPVHEIIRSVEPSNNLSYFDMILYEKKEGNSSRYPRYAKDVVMFKQWLAENDPEHPRCTYYLAQSMRDANQMEEAIPIYEKRAKMTGGWIQEAYVSAITLANYYYSTNRKAHAIGKCFQAIDIFPKRLEPYYFLLMWHEKSPLLSVIVNMCMSMLKEQDQDCTLYFLTQQHIYKYSFQLMMAESLYAINNKDMAIPLLEELLNKKRPPVDKIPLIEKLLIKYRQ